MPVATKAAALLSALRRADIEALSPAQRERLAQICRYVADMAAPATPEPKSGVLADVRRNGVHAE